MSVDALLTAEGAEIAELFQFTFAPSAISVVQEMTDVRINTMGEDHLL